MIFFSNIGLDPDQDQQNLEPDLHPNSLTLWCIYWAMLLSNSLDTDQVWPRQFWYYFQTHWTHIRPTTDTLGLIWGLTVWHTTILRPMNGQRVYEQYDQMKST